MNNLKGLNLIEDVLNNFLEDFEVTAEIGADFCYLWDKNVIKVSLAVPDFGAKMFMEDFHKRAPEIKIDCFLISFLHELGHCETVDELTDEEEAECLRKRTILNDAIRETTDEIKRAEMYKEYFAMTDEYLATEWAIDYIRNNVETVAELWAKLQKAILTFYEINEVEVA